MDINVFSNKSLNKIDYSLFSLVLNDTSDNTELQLLYDNNPFYISPSKMTVYSSGLRYVDDDNVFLEVDYPVDNYTFHNFLNRLRLTLKDLLAKTLDLDPDHVDYNLSDLACHHRSSNNTKLFDHTIRLKMDEETLVFDMNDEELELTLSSSKKTLCRGSEIYMILHLNNVMVVDNKFVCDFNIFQAKVKTGMKKCMISINSEHSEADHSEADHASDHEPEPKQNIRKNNDSGKEHNHRTRNNRTRDERRNNRTRDNDRSRNNRTKVEKRDDTGNNSNVIDINDNGDNGDDAEFTAMTRSSWREFTPENVESSNES